MPIGWGLPKQGVETSLSRMPENRTSIESQGTDWAGDLDNYLGYATPTDGLAHG